MSIKPGRRVKGRRVIAVTAVAAAAATTAFALQAASADETEPASAQGCGLETLPIPEGLVSTSVSGMSDDGSQIAYYALPLDQSWPDGLGAHPMLYADGEVTEVPMSGNHPRLAAVNASGVAAGYTEIDGYYVPYVWSDGELTELPGEGSYRVWGINEGGDIVGAGGDSGEMPVIWPVDGAGPVQLPVPEGAVSGIANGIGDDGTVVGAVYDENGSAAAYKWESDESGAYTGEALPLPEGADPDNAFGIAYDVNGDWASGKFFVPGAGVQTQGVRWNLAEDTAEMTELNYEVSVSADGTVVGFLPGTSSAAYQTGETVVELPGVEPAGDRPYDYAVEISADGSLIAGDVYIGRDEAGLLVTNAVIWTCE